MSGSSYSSSITDVSDVPLSVTGGTRLTARGCTLEVLNGAGAIRSQVG